MANTDLIALRDELDQIDARIVELLRQRIDVVERVAVAKRDCEPLRPAMRPAREAVIMRRLAAVGDTRLPAASLIRIWRELLAVTTRLQTPYSVVVCVKPEQPWIWDLARDHFGTPTPIQRADTPLQALRMVSSGAVDMAVLPPPSDEESWWHSLAGSQPDAAGVIARLPFCDMGGYPANASAYLVAHLDREPSGEDLTLIAVEAEAGLSRARLRDALDAAGLEPTWLATVRSDAEIADHLLEIKGFVEVHEPKIASAFNPLRERLRRIVALGCYPRPLAHGANSR